MDTSSLEFQSALADHARALGVDPDKETELLGLVEEALLAPLPDPWEQGETEDGTLYYFNGDTGESRWDHPLDDHYKVLIQDRKAEMEKARTSSKAESPVAKAAAPQAPQSMGFGRDRSWLLEEPEEDGFDTVSSFGKPAKPLVENASKPATSSGGAGASSLLGNSVTGSSLSKPSASSPSFTPGGTSLMELEEIDDFPSVSSFSMKPSRRGAITASSAASVAKSFQEVDSTPSVASKTYPASKQSSEDVTRLEAEVKELSSKLEKAVADAKEANYLKMKVADLKARKTSGASEMDDLKKSHKKELEALEKKLVSDKKAAEEQVQKELAAVRQSLALEREKNENLEKAKSEVAEALRSVQEELSKEKQSGDGALESATKEKSELLKQVASLREELDRSRSSVEEEKTRMVTLEGKLRQESEARAKELQAQLDERESQLSEVERQKREESARLLEAEGRVTKLQETIDSALKEQQRLESEAESKSRQWEGSNSTIEELRSELSYVEKKLREEESRSRSLEVQLKASEKKLESADADTRAQVERVRDEMQDSHRQVITKLQEACAAAEDETRKVQREKKALEDQAHGLETRLERLSQEMQSCKSSEESAKHRVAQQEAQCHLLLQDKAAAEARAASAESESRRVQQEKRDDVASLSRAMRELEAGGEEKQYRIKRLEDKVSAAERWRQKESERAEEREKEVYRLREELAKAKNTAVEAEQGRKDAEILELKQSRQGLADKLSSLESALREAHECTAAAEERVAQAESNYERRAKVLTEQCLEAANARWVTKCEETLKRVKAQWAAQSESEKAELVRELHGMRAEQAVLSKEWERAKTKNRSIEWELQRAEDRNKCLLDQLASVRSWEPASRLGQTPEQAKKEDKPVTAPVPQPEVPAPQLASINDQLRLLHSQFEQVLRTRQDSFSNANQTRRHSQGGRHRNRRQQTRPVERVEEYGADDGSSDIDVLLDNLTRQSTSRRAPTRPSRQGLITALETLRLQDDTATTIHTQMVPEAVEVRPIRSRCPDDAFAMAETQPSDGTTVWYQRDYWKSRYG